MKTNLLIKNESGLFRCVLFFACLITCLMAPLFYGRAQAGLVLSPTRVILDNRNNTAKVSVVNKSKQSNRYRVGLTMYTYSETGGLVEVTNPDDNQKQLMKMIRFSPRQATIQANARQVVRLQYRKPKNLPDGEYRVHLKVNPLPSKQTASAFETSSTPGLRIKLLVGMSIPIVVRNGDLRVEATPWACKAFRSAQTGKPSLKVTINRQGTRSAMMDIKVFHVSTTNNSKKILIGKAHNAVIYPEFDQKEFEIPLDGGIMPEQLKTGRIRVELSNKESGMGRRHKDTNTWGTAEFDSAVVFDLF